MKFEIENKVSHIVSEVLLPTHKERQYDLPSYNRQK